MVKKVVVTGRTVEEAVRSALVRLGVAHAQATIRVLKEPVKGLFGFIGGKDAEVEVSVRMSAEESTREFLAGVLRRMGVESTRVRTKVGEEEGKPMVAADVVCEEEDLPVVIGRHGSTLEALQYLTNVVVNQTQEGYIKVIVDAGDYRRRRREGLQRMADRAASRALKTKRSVAMDPMPPSDRKFIHTYLQQRSDVTTSSEGADPNRRVIVLPLVQSGPPRIGLGR